MEHRKLVSVGDLAPDFELPAVDGTRVRLAESLRNGPILLGFFRGHWCPYCRRYLAKLQLHVDRFASEGVGLLAISPEPIATSAMLSRELSLGFPLLSDVEGAVIDAYGIRNRFASARSLLPHPSVFLIDRDRRVRFRSIDRNYKVRTSIRTIFREIAACFGPDPLVQPSPSR